MPDRFIFRQCYYKDLALFLRDGEIRAKNHSIRQRCHQTSYEAIVNRRGTDEFPMPCGGVVNDYVPFYFSPLTAFAYTIDQGNVPLIDPDGNHLGTAKSKHRIFVVCNVEDVAQSDVDYCFSDYPLNSKAPLPTLETDLTKLENHVHWDVFDEAPYRAKIPQIGYQGVCQFFKNMEHPPERQLRRQKRMAEFLVRDALPMGLVTCVVAKSDTIRDRMQSMMDASEWSIPVLSNAGCYF